MKKIKTINNITIKETYNNQYACCVGQTCYEEFDTLQNAEKFCEETFDFCDKVYECTFWDYYDNEFSEYAKKFNTKQKALDYINKISGILTFRNVRLYFNDHEIKI